MKTNVTTLFAGMLALGTLGACSTTSQYADTNVESDPLYFTAQDRAAITPKITKLNDKTTADYDNKEYQYEEQSISSKTVNPDVVAQYQNDGQPDNAGEVNDEYYVEDYNRPYGNYGSQPQVVNNYYGNPRRFSSFGSPFYGGGFYDPYSSFYDPFYDPYYNSFAYGNSFYSPFRRPGFNMSLGFGFGSPFGFNRFNRFGYGRGLYGYDPFFGPSLAYGGYGGYYQPNVLIVDNREIHPTSRRISRGRTAATNSRLGRSATTGSATQNRSSVRRTGTSSDSRSSITSSQNDAYRNNGGRRYSTSSGAAAYQRAQTRTNQRSSSRYNGSDTRSSRQSQYTPQRSTSRSYQRSNSSGNGSYRSSSYGSRSSRSYGSSNSSSFGRSSSSSPSRSYSSGSSSRGTRSSSSGASRSSGGSRRP